jgi:hypothetical protein
MIPQTGGEVQHVVGVRLQARGGAVEAFPAARYPLPPTRNNAPARGRRRGRRRLKL